MFVDYSEDHDGDCYEMWYLQTNRIYTTRDVIWMKKMYYSDDNIKLEAATNVFQIENVGKEEVNETEEEKEVKNDEQPAVTEDDYPAGTLRSGTTYRDIAAAKLAQFPLQLTQAEENYLNYMKECNEIACAGAGIGGGFEHTTELHVMKFDAAMKSRDAAHWKNLQKKSIQGWRTMRYGVQFPSRKSRKMQKFLT
jgi:hypothetical protein